MRTADREVDLILTRLRNLIRAKGFTQQEVQDALGWGRSYISQLLTRQKALRVEQVVMILKVINVDAGSFWAEVYPRDESKAAPMVEVDGSELQRLARLYDGIVGALKKKGLISAEDLAAAIKKAQALDI